VLRNHDLPQVNPHPLLDRQARSGAEGTQLRLGQQGEPNRIRRFGERQQE
jgi:hypothetical protein